MKVRNIALTLTLTLLIIIGVTVSFTVNSETQPDKDLWEVWVDQQTETMLKSAGEVDEEQLAEMRASIKAKFTALATELKKDIASPPQTQKEKIDKQVEMALKKLTTEGLTDLDEIVKQLENLSIGGVIDVNKLADIDILPEVRVITSPPKVHVKTYVEKKSFDSSELDDMDISPEVRVETRVLKGLDTEGQKDLPKNVPQNVKALRDAYDKHYNETATTTSASVVHKKDGKTILEYKTPLPLEEVDEKYPRDEWIQMLLDEEITIDNFQKYHAYLLERDALVHIEKQPKVWSSGLFSIEPTDDWETYKDAYVKEKVFKLNPLIITEIVKDTDELKELTEKLKNLAADKKLDADELAEKVKALVKNLDVKSTTIFDTDEAEGLVIKPHGSTKVFKYSNSVKELEERIEKLEKKIEKLIEKFDENHSQPSETK